jgi:hypothetical protein
MAVERYICRSTPDYAALSLLARQVVADILKWTAKLYGGRGAQDAVAAALAAPAGKQVPDLFDCAVGDSDYHLVGCTAWLDALRRLLLADDIDCLHGCCGT